MSADLESLDFLVCRYSCHVCGIVDAKVFVPVRNADEDVEHWIEHTLAGTLGRDHTRRSPGCIPETLSDVKIPFPEGTERVGDRPKN